MVCGYSNELRTFDSLTSIGVKIASVDPFGGAKRVAIYGHCGNTNVRIQMETGKGLQTVCVSPGSSYLGMVHSGRKVTNAWYIGNC
ncbi:DUF6355 family natural product biosynthesis protein [Glutamicibacter sp. TV12E]|uniref:DUF6355 family natural product biosynthesis protein n=1 Tax=Glutamicibacter sp. TV12E TaxID=3446362 RepID=UPI0040345E5F